MTRARTRAALAICTVVALAAAALAEAPYVDPRDDASYLGDPAQFLFWAPEQKVAGFRNIAAIFPTRGIEAGGDVLALPDAAEPITELPYAFEGESLGIDDYMARGHVVGLIAVQDGQVVLERYASGNDATSRWVSFSVAKSVVSMLVGAALLDGYIASVEEPVTDYLPRLKGSAYDDVTLGNLLQMASGVAWNEDYADPASDVNTMPPDIVGLYGMLSGKSRVGPAGATFNYNTAETNLVGAVLRAAIGNNLATYLTHKVWQPFGMEADANWMTHGPGGGELGGCCINATLRDYARIGLFALADGVLADGTRVLPEGWMEASTAASEGSDQYGYLWWLWPEGQYRALGIFGQTIAVSPDRNLVVATHGAAPTAIGGLPPRHREAFFAALAAHLDARAAGEGTEDGR